MTQAEADEPAADFDLGYLISRVTQRWKFIIAMMSVFLMATLSYLHIATPKYMTSYRVTPASSSTAGVSRSLGSFGNIAAIAGVSLGTGRGGATPFELYVDLLTSRSLAYELARDPRIMQTVFASQWDSAGQRWRQPDSLIVTIIGFTRSLIGMPARKWQSPNDEDLQKFIVANLKITEPGPRDAPITRIAMTYKDPSFSEYLLKRMGQYAEMRIRLSGLSRAKDYANFLSLKLANTENSEHRRVLGEALAEQERVVMMTSSISTPYSVVTIEPPNSDKRPIEPNYIVTAFAGPFAGMIFGMFIALLDWSALRRFRP